MMIKKKAQQKACRLMKRKWDTKTEKIWMEQLLLLKSYFRMSPFSFLRSATDCNQGGCTLKNSEDVPCGYGYFLVYLQGTSIKSMKQRKQGKEQCRTLVVTRNVNANQRVYVPNWWRGRVCNFAKLTHRNFVE